MGKYINLDIRSMSYINENGKKVSGAAAREHFLKEVGGLDKYINDHIDYGIQIGLNIIPEIANQMLAKMNIKS